MGRSLPERNGRWNPWRHLSRHHPHIRVSCSADLPGTQRASWTADGVYLDRALDQTARRCALAHEIIHIERGPVPDHPHLAAVEERIVSALAARLLISFASLADAIMWASPTSEAELADELWVDVPTLRIRLRSLTFHERATLKQAVHDRHPWHCDP